jgi:choline dehydrogenase-like flavoprotein
MFVDARSLPAGTVVETEICIVGAGAAGITLAREFSNARFRVALLESGDLAFDPGTQELYEGESIGQPFEMTGSRLRFFGGTTNHWGGWCLPYDAVDFETREDLPYHGWPFTRSYLDPWYRRAHEVCRLGPYDYRPSSWGIKTSTVPPPFAGPHFECKVLQESGVHFGPVYGPELRRADNVTVYLNANAYRFDAGEAGNEIRELFAKTLSGSEFTVRSRIYVLAAGGIENARLLLASGRNHNGLGNDRDLVGRFFMTHLIFSGGVMVPSDPDTNFDFRTEARYVKDGTEYTFYSFIALTPSTMHLLHLPNLMLRWTYRFSDTMAALKHAIDGESSDGRLLTDLSRVIGDLDGVADFAARKLLFGSGLPVAALNLLCCLEQQPNPQSRVRLGAQRDRLGMPQVVVDWRPAPDDKSKAVAALRLLATEIGRTGFGRLRCPLLHNDEWPEDFYGNEHHMGTTRMHRDPALGVVDENCRLHTVANLYIAGSSVFPTGGANNPTLTIVALALRLADHVKRQLE